MRNWTTRLLCLALCYGLLPQALDAQARFSLLTVSPGKEVWNRFGHTALRYTDPVDGTDEVYNYGLFDFSRSGFIWRFTLGQTDYILGKEPYRDFEASYRWQGRGILETDLRLTDPETARLRENLERNAMPQNRTYRYNFLFNNCATRPLEKLEAVTGPLELPPGGAPETFRGLIGHYTATCPWARTGIDLVLGTEADRPITVRESLFAPDRLREALEKAVRTRGALSGDRVTGATRTLLEKDPSVGAEARFPLTPVRAALLALMAVAACSIRDVRRRKAAVWVDLLLLLLLGLGGCLVCLIAFFSEHPAVLKNYNILILNPIHLVLLPLILQSLRKGRRSRAVWMEGLLPLCLVILLPLLPQRIPALAVILSITLLLRLMALEVIQRQDARADATPEKLRTSAGQGHARKPRKS